VPTKHGYGGVLLPKTSGCLLGPGVGLQLRPVRHDPTQALRLLDLGVDVRMTRPAKRAQIRHRVICYARIGSSLYVVRFPLIESLRTALTAPPRLDVSLLCGHLVGRVCLPLTALLRCAQEAAINCRANN
jgi:hypothetical protein